MGSAEKQYRAAKRALVDSMNRNAISAPPRDLDEISVASKPKAPQEELPPEFYSNVGSAGLGGSEVVQVRKKKKKATGD